MPREAPVTIAVLSFELLTTVPPVRTRYCCNCYPWPYASIGVFIEAHLSAVTLGELQSGVEITRQQDLEKAAEIEAWIARVEDLYNVLPVDGPCFRAWARLMHRQPDDLVMDALIAATAAVHGLTIVTRNVRDFRRLGSPIAQPLAAVFQVNPRSSEQTLTRRPSARAAARARSRGRP